MASSPSAGAPEARAPRHADHVSATVHHYLEHEDERARIAEQGRRLVTEELTLRRSVARLLELLAEALHGKAGGSRAARAARG